MVTDLRARPPFCETSRFFSLPLLPPLFRGNRRPDMQRARHLRHQILPPLLRIPSSRRRDDKGYWTRRRWNGRAEKWRMRHTPSAVRACVCARGPERKLLKRKRNLSPRNFRDVNCRDKRRINSAKIVSRFFFPRRFDDHARHRFTTNGHDVERVPSKRKSLVPTAILSSSSNDFTQNACVTTLFRLPRHLGSMYFMRDYLAAENGAGDSPISRKCSLENFQTF